MVREMGRSFGHPFACFFCVDIVVKFIYNKFMRQFNQAIDFQWDQGNDLKNWKKHYVTKQEVEEVFSGFTIGFPDEKHSNGEKRYCIIGRSKANRILFIIYTLRANKTRVISARPSSKFERNLYEKTFKKYSKI